MTDKTSEITLQKVEFEYATERQELTVRIGNVDPMAHHYPISGQQRMKLAMELLGHGSVSAMISELEENRKRVTELEADLMRLHREWMVQNVELNAVMDERNNLRDLYLEEREKEVEILNGSAVQG